MQSNTPVQSWIPPQINCQEIVLSNQSKQDGFNKGYQEGLVKAAQESQCQLAQLNKLFFELSNIKSGLIKETESVLLDIAMRVAKKVINYELRVNKTIVETVIKEMLNKLPDMSEGIKIKGHPDDLEIIKKIAADQTDKEIELSVDPSLSVGCLKMKSGFTRIEYNIDEIFDWVVNNVTE